MSIRGFSNTVFGKLFWTLITFAFALTPFWLYLLAKSFFAPDGFWQNLLLLGLGFYFLGSIQLLLFLIAVAFVISMWLSRDFF